MRGFIARLGIVNELFSFLWKRKLYWLMPMIITLVIFSIFIIFAQVSGGGSYAIYALW